MILSHPFPSDNNSNTGTTTTRPRGMTLCSSFDNIIDAGSFVMADNKEDENENENNDEDIMFDGKLGDVLAAYFLPPPPPPLAIANISPTRAHTPTPTSSMEWNKNNDSNDNSSGVSKIVSSRTSKKISFPETLHRILDDVADGNVGMTTSSSSAASEIISWEEMGKGFKIYQPKAFNETILPRYAKRQTRYRSFQRQLNIYGFKMNKKSGIYHHEYFTRGDIHSLKKIRPAPNKNHFKNNLRKTSENTYKSSSSNEITPTISSSSSSAVAVAVEQRRVRGRRIVSSEEDDDSSSSSSSSSSFALSNNKVNKTTYIKNKSIKNMPIVTTSSYSIPRNTSCATFTLMRKLSSSVFSSAFLPKDTTTGGTYCNIMPIDDGINDDCLEDIDVTNISSNIDIDTTTSGANANNTAVYTAFDDRDFLSDISDIPAL